jgi:FKBP-type peptidyl-prolyl cis-trans isomerase 2
MSGLSRLGWSTTFWPIAFFTGPAAPAVMASLLAGKIAWGQIADRLERREVYNSLPVRSKTVKSVSDMMYNYYNKEKLAKLYPDQYAARVEAEQKNAQENSFFGTDTREHEFTPLESFPEEHDHFKFGLYATSQVTQATSVYRAAKKGDVVVVAVAVKDLKTGKIASEWDAHKQLIFYAGETEELLPQLNDAVIGLLPGEEKVFKVSPAERGIKSCEETVTRLFDTMQVEQLEYAIGLDFHVPDKFGNTRIAKVTKMVPDHNLSRWKVTFQFDREFDDSDLEFRVQLVEVLEGQVYIAPPTNAHEADFEVGIKPSA